MQTTLLAMLLCALLSGAAGAEQLLFDSAEDWASWTMPHDLNQVGTDGRLRLVKFRRDVNAVEDAHLFSYESPERGLVNGGVWDAGSNAGDAPLVIDGDPATFWQPDLADEPALGGCLRAGRPCGY